MNSKDRDRLYQLKSQADALMDSPGSDPDITNLDVIEALLGDITRIAGGCDPEAIQALVEMDQGFRVAEGGCLITVSITPESLKLFLDLAQDAGNWSGTPPVWGTKEQRGNLTQLKRAGLLTTFTDRGDAFAEFTEAGLALAAKHGIEF